MRARAAAALFRYAPYLAVALCAVIGVLVALLLAAGTTASGR
jgi:ElaB/YqjD/DUF883 family membrane-anchored ribosome-binding protein